MTEPRIRTSTVIDSLLDVHQRLRDLSYPPSSDTNQIPQVFFLGYWSEMSNEYIHLVGRVPDDTIDHAGAGPSTRDEVYVLQVEVGTQVRGRDGVEAVTRLKEITDVVEAAFRHPTTGQPIPPDVDGVVVMGGIERFEVDGYLTDQGAAAVADIYIRVHARI